ncbi:NDP-glycosyltransferase YjiC-like [Oppia nitens]|uniref:NDP-glycosyltransferase YjiC-like n=1 Tax=Oppia nitens TaxID=1686743 RepID=UPI0023DC6469|nr:NDP-glycosyltransferase YjiC-like [Oppia nitens]
MGKHLKVVLFPIDAVGHVNSATGIAQVLLEAGHRVIFIISEQWRGKLCKYGIEELILDEGDKKPTGAEDSSNSGGGADDAALQWANLMKQTDTFTNLDPLVRLVNVRKHLYMSEMKRLETVNQSIERLLRDLRPDIVLTDQFMTVPAIMTSGIPWIWWCSPNPLVFIDDDRTPPGCSGLPTTGPKSEWQSFRNVVNEASLESWTYWNSYCMGQGCQPLDKYRYQHFSPYLNIYGFPLELDYLDIRPLPDKWLRFDNLKRQEVNTGPKFEIPESLLGKPGKLVYFSLGSMGGADVDLMKRLVGILAKSRNRFIVSKGPGDRLYDLPDNMWGRRSVPQIQVLPVVDLVITHGGNNTVTETLYFGKPMLVLPLWGDQWDNGQRIAEKGLGLSLNAHKCTEDELIKAVDSLLEDSLLEKRLAKIAQRIQSDNSIGKLPEIIENLLDK